MDKAPPTPVTPIPKAPVGLKVIAGAKIVKGAALCLLSLGVLDLVHKDVAALARQLVHFLRISTENRYVALLLEKAGVIEPSTIRRLGELSALDASTQLVEGLGLWFGAVWAEYVVVISTGVYIPEESIVLHAHFTWVRLTVLVVNAAILAYVAWVVWKRHRMRRDAKAARKAIEEGQPTPGAAGPGAP
jgi:uncharacterized membrane protein (DUF2068 family)